MHVTFRNVNDALMGLVSLFHRAQTSKSPPDVPIRSTTSRNGNVLVIDEPVTVTYRQPEERVLFNQVRNANPFFHLYEALWMLSGRNDVGSIGWYVKQVKEYSDDGKTLNGAYGYRWRHHQTDIIDDRKGPDPLMVDQLQFLVTHLKAQPDSRRAVLQMWNVEDDLLKIGGMDYHTSDFKGYGLPGTPTLGKMTIGTSNPGSKDVCCNLSVMFSLVKRTIRVGLSIYGPHPTAEVTFLDMTVINRSNDMVWGMLGTNYVHFSVLMEYMAAKLGARVGLYHHMTNNLHVYVDRKDWDPERILHPQPDAEPDDVPWLEYYPRLCNPTKGHMLPLVKDATAFDVELPLVVDLFSSPQRFKESHLKWEQITEPFLRDVAYPLLAAHYWYKTGDGGDGTIQDCVSNIVSADWRVAAREWLERKGVTF